ncbi:MAG: triose-phosphate isomerase [Planctomycetota bacterium]|jgi:triosephosphate isomerase
MAHWTDRRADRGGKIVAGNWKLQPPRGEGVELFRAILAGLGDAPVGAGGPGAWVIPPAPYLGLFGGELPPGAPLGLGAQDLAPCGYGAHTGELGGELLADFGCALVLVGHSERRQGGESDPEVAEKALAADRAGLLPLLCVGESEVERDQGDTIAVVERQLTAVLSTLAPERPLWVAYEPVWAIGTGRTATSEQVVEVHHAIRKSLARGGRDGAGTPILYGGSVNPSNAGALLAEEEIDGALVGGASLKAESFLAIVEAGATVSD